MHYLYIEKERGMHYLYIDFKDTEDQEFLIGLGTHNGLGATYSTYEFASYGLVLKRDDGHMRIIPWRRINEVTTSEDFLSDAMLEEESGSEVLPD